jgi:predicted nucleic acid-binding Zn ribbon protein
MKLSEDRGTITIRGKEHSVKRIYPPHLGHDKKAYIQVVYYKKKNQLVWTTGSISVRVCRFCGAEIDTVRGSGWCSEKCRNKQNAQDYRDRKAYIDLVPEYLRKYMVVVENGETWPSQD